MPMPLGSKLATPLDSATSSASGNRRIRGLDGLRAIAVLLVIAYHLAPQFFPGGFLGVDLFFVLSGFLITDQLRREWAVSGGINLRRFWVKRARRLLPALTVVVIVGCAATVFVAADTGVHLPSQLLGAFTFSSNWVDIANATSYFSASVQPLFQNLWSLAVEEQFYFAWPIIFIAGSVALKLRRAIRLPLIMLVVLASLSLPVVYLSSGASTSRVYFGTDTHSYALIIGAALAFFLSGDHSAEVRTPRWIDRHRRVLPDLLIAVSTVGILIASFCIDAASELTFALWLPLICLAAAALICGLRSPSSRLVQLFEFPLLQGIGRRSYGIYLWHWPIFVLTSSALGDSAATSWVWPPALITLALTLLLAGISYRQIEQPIMRGGFRITVAQWRFRYSRAGVIALITVPLILITITASAGIGVVFAPPSTVAEQFVLAGQQHLAAAEKLQAQKLLAEKLKAKEAQLSPTATPEVPPNTTGADITAIGDSVMLASASALLNKFPGISIDAKVSRQTSDAAAIVADLAQQKTLRRVLIVALGTNGLYRSGDIADIQNAAGPGHKIVLVNTFGPRNWIPGVNAQIAQAAAANPYITIADWSSAISGHGDLLAPDQIHPSAAGAELYATAIADALQR